MKSLVCFLALSFLMSANARWFRSSRLKFFDSTNDRYRDRSGKRPNIVYIMADDLGWNDVGFHNPKVRTPNLNALRAKGIELSQFYVQESCSPTRSALLTGKYPSRNGLQQMAVQLTSPFCLPLTHKTLYQYMKEEGYVTKHVGKWHLGDCNERCLPNNRGVDEFRGGMTGAADYFNWTDNGVMTRERNGMPTVENIGTHLTTQDTIDARELILAHRNNPNPLFMWITPTAPHDPLQVTNEMFNVHDFLNPSDPEEEARRRYLGLVSAFDDMVGVTMTTLQEAGIADNTIIIFSSDNGGPNGMPPFPEWDYAANNYPLRNNKGSLTEGGVRTPTIYYDPRLHPRTRGTTRDFLIHVTDWLPTFLHLANPKRRRIALRGIDGVSQLPNLGSRYTQAQQRKYHRRSEMLVGLNGGRGARCSTENAVFRWKDYKLLYGLSYFGAPTPPSESEWRRPEESPELPAIIGDDCHRIVDGQRVVRCLFNVRDDPSETRNLYDLKPQLVEKLIRKIQQAKEDSVTAVFRPAVGVSSATTQLWRGFTIPRHDYCTPETDFPLRPVSSACINI
ncbi:arylsulfatase B-like [Watersipora subatra]|uniref:arylsulfatase B-like n=1 Tax=Watersipora subatra TaxID=2589382 RepID=UPI00355C55C2